MTSRVDAYRALVETRLTATRAASARTPTQREAVLDVLAARAEALTTPSGGVGASSNESTNQDRRHRATRRVLRAKARRMLRAR